VYVIPPRSSLHLWKYEPAKLEIHTRRSHHPPPFYQEMTDFEFSLKAMYPLIYIHC
jgi:hypothetical protein